MAGGRYDQITEGSTTYIEFEGYPQTGGRIEFVSGTIQVFDSDFVALAGFETPVACPVVDGRLRYVAAWGDGAGLLPAPTARVSRYVEWEGVDANGVHWVSDEHEWPHKPRLGG
jgi:hypothetical protein